MIHPVSKVLVLDNSEEHAPKIKQFCDDNHLFALKVRKGSVMKVLRTNIDLGGILYSESYGDSPAQTASIALAIHAARPELPMIIRRESRATMTDFSDDDGPRVYCAQYVASDMGALRQVIDDYIFCLIYPNALLRGIREITTTVLSGQFKAMTVTMDTPNIVHDRVIFGELFSLIQLESSWCRGYMMVQTEEAPFLTSPGRDLASGTDAVLRRTVNDRLSEITNLIWGSFKNRYIGDAKAASGGHVQVPLIVNHKHKYISFGTENPQLCFRFTLQEPVSGQSSKLYVRFIFNLSWSPEDFKEIAPDVANLVESGEMELF